ncbi:hypothetical protein ACG2LH_12105 [Zhouia sp. PK063]|uniref:hypothetical protein n=1 Tax=Zhouia sp. PK063 TaxID=3373602 RepID=UPI0037ACB880
MRAITKNHIHFICFFLGIGLFTCKAQESATILGIWKNEDKTHEIKFYKTQYNTYEACIWEEGTAKAKIIKDLVFKENEYKNGSVYLPKRNVWLTCNIVIQDEILYLTAKKGWLSKTKKWTRVK